MFIRLWSRLAVVLAITALTATLYCDDVEKTTSNRRPERFAIIFNMGYAGDNLPGDPKSFELLLRGIKEAHFNTILCKYEDWRAQLCKKHDLQIFVDLLAPGHHVYKNVAETRKLCESLRGKDVVYGYHLWSDNISGTYPGRSRDVKNVHEWDPTHPAYIGSYRMSRVNRVEGLDLLGYYDFHWTRGGHWGNLSKASAVARGKNVFFLRYCDSSPGRIGAGNPNRAGYTIATSIPFGLKGYLYHYRGGVVEPEGGKLAPLGKDLKKVNAKFAAIGDKLISIGNPMNVWSTPITRTAKDRPAETAPAVPGGLSPIPADHWFQVRTGEVLLGLFKSPDGGEVIAAASHNAYQSQQVTLEFSSRVKKARIFNRKSGNWVEPETSGKKIAFSVEEHATELLKIER